MFSLFDGLFDGFWGYFVLIPAAGIAYVFLLFCMACFLFDVPYALWRGFSSQKIPTISEESSRKGFLHETANAFRLYRSWITKKPHGIRYFTK